MKSFITLIALMFATVAISNAQSTRMTGSGDSVVNAQTKYCSVKPVGVNDAISIQITLTKASGTVAGKTYLQGTVDGTNYVTLDSMTATNQTTNTKVFIVASPKNYASFRTTTVGTGTMKAYISAYALVRKEQ